MATDHIHAKTEQLVAKLKDAMGGDLVSVILFGSAASGEYLSRFSDINVMCVVARLGPEQLGKSEPVVRWWQGQGNPSPLMLTEHEVATSTDCFSIEFQDMKRHHEVLFGKDVVSGLEIDGRFYRAQVECELRGKLLRLRQKAAAVLSDKDVLRRLMVDSLSSFCVLLRHAVILAGGDGEGRKRDVIERAGGQFGLDPKPFLELLDLREERRKPKEVDPAPLLAVYLNEIGKVIDAVDALEHA